MAIATTVALIVVVSISNGGLSPDTVNRAVSEADAIWRDAGVAIEWHRDGEPASPSIVARFVEDRGHAGRRQVAIAWIDVVDGRPAPTIYVSHSNALALLRSAHILAGELQMVPAATSEILGRALGRAIAHEIGHYLFSSRTHDAKGLMSTERTPLQMFGEDRLPFLLTYDERLRLAQVIDRQRLQTGAASPLHAATGHGQCPHIS